MLNLYNILLENVDCDKLIEEGKDPVEVLHYKFQNVPSNIIDEIISIDPTKKKSYSQWALSKWEDENDVIVKAINDGRLEKLFDHYKTHSEIQIKDCPSVKEGLDNFVPEEDTVLTKSSEPTTYIKNQDREVDSKLANDFDIVFNEDDWIIAVPHTYEAAGKLGENTKWCTTGCYGNDNYYHHYLKKGGEYYVNFDMREGETLQGKDYPFTRYQFHFESKQFMDSHDDPVSAEDMDIPDSAIDFYQEIDSDYIVGEKTYEVRYEEYEELRWNDAIRINNELYLNVEFDEDLEYSEPSLDGSYWYVFSYDDNRDPISWTAVDPNIDESVILNDDYVLVIRKGGTARDKYVVFTQKEGRYGSYWEENGEVLKIINVPRYDDFYVGLFSEKKNKYYLGLLGDNAPSNTVGCDRVLFSGEENFLFDPNNLKSEEFEYFEEYVYAFLETWEDDGYHSLFAICDDEIYCIVMKDKPLNSEHFYLNENNEVVGEFRTYPLDGDYNEEKQGYHFVSKLEGNDYLVTFLKEGYYNKNTNSWAASTVKQTILDGETKQPIGDIEFKEYIGTYDIGYLVNLDDESRNIVTFDGKFLFDKDYKEIKKIVGNTDLFACKEHQPSYSSKPFTYDLYDASTNQMLLKHIQIDLSHAPINGEMVIGAYDERTDMYEKKVFNVNTKEFMYNNFKFVQLIGGSNYLAGVSNDDIWTIIDLRTNEVVMDGITTVRKSREMRGHSYICGFSDGTCNIFHIDSDGATGTVLLDHNVKKINDTRYNTFIGEDVNNTMFVYNIPQNKYLFKNLPHDFSLMFDNYGGATILILCGDIKLLYDISLNRIQTWGRWSERYINTPIHDETPQEVLDLVRKVMKYANVDEPSYSVSEEFKKTLNRINEARKLTFKDLY